MARFRTYQELRRIQSFEGRFDYLKLPGEVGISTFGFDRWMNQQFYQSPEWRDVRQVVILRDEGCDLGIPGYEIGSGLLIHHINPVKPEDLRTRADWILDPNYLITTTQRTRNAIHYGDKELLP